MGYLDEEYTRNPYKIHGNELIYYFEDLIKQTDKWTLLPLKEGDYFIDFIKGFKEQKIIEKIPNQDDIDLNKNYSGFVKIHHPDEFKLVKQIDEKMNLKQTVYYLQKSIPVYKYLEMDINNLVVAKVATFTKNNFMMTISSSIDLRKPDYEFKINTVIKGTYVIIDDEYRIDIIQEPKQINIMINRVEDFMEAKPPIRFVHPLVNLLFDKDKYTPTLNKLASEKNMFLNFSTIRNYFGHEQLSSKSALLKYFNKKSTEKKNITLNQVLDEFDIF